MRTPCALLFSSLAVALCAAPAQGATPAGGPIRACYTTGAHVRSSSQRYQVHFVDRWSQCPKGSRHVWMNLQGLPGPQGMQGPAGPSGIPGERGAAGAQGATGAQGERGLPGPAGTQGAAGTPGAQGETGTQGPQGPAGAQGPTGNTGATGATGPKGDTGATGPQGPAGRITAPQQVTQSAYTDNASSLQAVARCPTGKVAVSGGYMLWPERTDLFVTYNRPDGTDGWQVRATNPDLNIAWQVTAYVMCVPTGA